MKKINNKGFAISTIIYSILIIAILIMGTLYSTIAFRKKSSSDFTHKVEEQLNNLEIKSYTICKKATSLHQDKYGKLITGDTLEVGAAFDCDVNGDNSFDPENERFYYLSPENGNDSSDNLVFIYYNNTGVNEDITFPCPNCKIKYDSNSNDGNISTYQARPDKAKEYLPLASSWKNTSLIMPGTGDNQNVNITDEKGTVKVTNFSYKGYSARFPRISEIMKATGVTEVSLNNNHNDSISTTDYNFLYENLVNTCGPTPCASGYWLENASSRDKGYAWSIRGGYNGIYSETAYTDSTIATRPVIVVNKENVYYK